MGGISLTQAMQDLGITRTQAEAMDEADGSKDGNIGKSIFNEAKEAVSQGEEAKASFFAKIMQKVQELKSVKKAKVLAMNVIQYVKDKLQLAYAVQDSAHRADDVAQPTVSETAESYQDCISEEETRKSMTDMADKAVEYYKKCGSFKGFKYTGFPKDVTNVKFDARFLYDDSSNDTFDFNTQSVTREADLFVLKITYSRKEPNGTITQDSTWVSVVPKEFEQTPIVEEFVGQLSDAIKTTSAGSKPIMKLE